MKYIISKLERSNSVWSFQNIEKIIEWFYIEYKWFIVKKWDISNIS